MRVGGRAFSSYMERYAQNSLKAYTVYIKNIKFIGTSILRNDCPENLDFCYYCPFIGVQCLRILILHIIWLCLIWIHLTKVTY